MAFALNTKQVITVINKIDGKKLRLDIQAACINIVGHAMQHGSSPLVEVLMDRMGATPMLRKLAPPVQNFLLKHGPFVHSKAGGWQFSKARKASIVEAGYVFESWAETAPLWDDVEKAKKDDVTLDLFKEFERLITKAEKAVTAGLCSDADLLPYLSIVKARYVADKALAEAKASSKAAATEPSPMEEGLARLFSTIDQKEALANAVTA